MTLVLEGAAAAVAAPRPRPLVTPDMIARQFERLADWHVQTCDPDRVTAGGPAPLKVGHLLAGPAHAAVFDALCDVVDRIDDLDNDRYEFGDFEEPEVVELVAWEARNEVLALLTDAAALRVSGASTCSICLAPTVGGHRPNCGWFTRPTDNTLQEA